MKINTALCCIDDDSFVVKTYIVHILYMDNAGNLYFSIPNPLSLSENVNHFPVSFTFYRKAYDYYVQLNAIATIEKDSDDEIQDDEKNKYVLIKAQITQAEYVEHGKPFPQKGIFNTVKQTLSSFSKSFATFFY
jgi:general stress protein 26